MRSILICRIAATQKPRPMNPTLFMPQPPSRPLPSMLLKAGEHRAMLAAVVGLHVAAAALLIGQQTNIDVAPETQITVSLLESPAPTHAAAPRPKPPTPSPTPAPRPVAQPARPIPVLANTPASTPTPTASPSATPVAISASPAPSELRPSVPQAAAEISTQARFDANYLQNPAPIYPPLSRRMQEEGKVILRVSVTPQGLAESVEVKTSSGSERLDQAALRAVKQWKFVPARRGDIAVQSWVQVPVQFKLEQ